MPLDASKAVKTMFNPDEQKILLANPKFLRALADFKGTADCVQRLADCGTALLSPPRRPSKGG
jgi:hypothetical protein